jgi:hypothetical protein
MYIRGLTVQVEYEKQKDVDCTDEDRVVTDMRVVEQIQKLQRSVIALEHQRDSPTCEEKNVCELKSQIATLEARLLELMAQMKSSSDQYEKQLCSLEEQKHGITTQISPNMQLMRELSLGAVYLEASQWLCNPAYPCFPRCEELTKEQLRIFLCNIEGVLKGIDSLANDKRVLEESVANMVNNWSLRYAAICDLFMSSECDVEAKCCAIKAFDRTIYSDNTKGLLMELAQKTHNASNNCLIDLMRQFYTFQTAERKCVAAISETFDCCAPPFANIACLVKQARSLIDRCNECTEKMDPIEHGLFELHASNKGCKTGVIDEVAHVKALLCKLRGDLSGLMCVIETRHNQLNEEIGCLNKELSKWIKVCPCKEPTTQVATIQGSSCDSPDTVVRLSAACGSRLTVATDLFVPGYSMDYSLSLFPHHEAKIGDIKAQIEIMKKKQDAWSGIACGTSLIRPDIVASMISALLPAELQELIAVAGRSAEGEDVAPLETRVTPVVAQGLVFYWSKGMSNLCIQLAKLEREQSEGVIKHVDGTATFIVEHFDWSWHGMWTIRVTNETLATALYHNLELTVIPGTAKGEFRSWKEWFNHRMLEPVTVLCDAVMPHVGMNIGAPMPRVTPAQNKFVKTVPRAISVASVPDRQLGHLVESFARDMNVKNIEQENNPHKFLAWMHQNGHQEAKQAVARIQAFRQSNADAVAARMQRFGKNVDAQSVLHTETWASYRQSVVCSEPLSVECIPAAPCAPEPCTTTLDPEEHDRWNAKLCRVAERQLIAEYPYYAMMFFSSCSQKHLRDFISNRATSKRWSMADLSEAEHNGVGATPVVIEANKRLCAYVEEYICSSNIEAAIADVTSFGPLLIHFFFDLCAAWKRFFTALVMLDKWIECSASDLAIQASQPTTVQACCAEIESARAALLEVISCHVLPRCDASNIPALCERMKQTLATNQIGEHWHQVVDAHLFAFEGDAPWTRIAKTCYPLEWLGVSIEVADRRFADNEVLQALCEDVKLQLLELDKQMKEVHIPALIKWLCFSLSGAPIPFTNMSCAGDLIVDSDINKGLHPAIAKSNEFLKLMTDNAYEGEEKAQQYEGFDALIASIQEKTSKALHDQKEVQLLRGFLSDLEERYSGAGWIRWKERSKNNSSFIPRDLVTCGMRAHAERWTRNPFDDLIELALMLEGLPLVGAVYRNWLAVAIKWAKCNIKYLTLAECEQQSHVPNMDIIKMNFGDWRTAALAKELGEDAPTMEQLICSYRDLIDCDRARDMFSSRDYFDIEMKIAIAYYSIAIEITEKLSLVLEDLQSHTICLPPLACQFESDAEKRHAAITLLEDIAESLQEMESPCSLYGPIWEKALIVWKEHILRTRLREAQREIAVNQRKPWLALNADPCPVVKTTERVHLLEIARCVFSSTPSALLLCDLYELLLDFLQVHYVCVPTPEERCTGSNFSIQLYEHVLWRLSTANLEAEPAHLWIGTEKEDSWRNHGVSIWEHMLRIEELLELLALNSPGCDEEDTPPQTLALRVANHFEPMLHAVGQWVEADSVTMPAVDKTRADLLARIVGVFGSLFADYASVALIAKEEDAREGLVAPASRVYMFPSWLLSNLFEVYPDLMVMGAKLFVDPSDKSATIPLITEAQLSSDHMSMEKTGALAAFTPGLEGRLVTELYPMLDGIVSHAFYECLRVMVSEDDVPAGLVSASNLALVVNILRNHGLRSAIYNLLPVDVNTSDYVSFGTPVHPDASHYVQRDGLATYFDLLSVFFYRLNLSHPAVFSKAWTAVENNHNVYRSDNDEGTFAFYFRKEEDRTAFETSKTDAFDQITAYDDSLQQTEDDADKIKAVWTKNREAVWWTGITQSFEHKQPKYSKFFVDFLTAFVRVDRYVMDTDTLFTLVAKDADPVLTVAPPEARNILKWLAANFKANAETGEDEDAKQRRYTSLEAQEQAVLAITEATEEEQ